MTDLRSIIGDNSSNASGINSRGPVVGQSWFCDGENTTASYALLWEEGGPMLDLDTLVTNPTDLYLTEANFITDRGWIVANGLHPSGEACAAILIPEDDASELTFETNPTNGGPALRPLPPTREMPRSFEQPIAATWVAPTVSYQAMDADSRVPTIAQASCAMMLEIRSPPSEICSGNHSRQK
jgi:probable HAF family extracellular repeat protein